MPLPSFLQRKTVPPEPRKAPLDEAGEVQAARTRARRRLIGAVVLLTVGVVGFPMLFETQPRPLPTDLPIVAPGATGAGASTLPSPTTSTGVVVAEGPPLPPALPERTAPSGTPAADSAPAASALTPAVPEPLRAGPEPEPASAAPTAPEPSPVAPPQAEAERARALLEGAPASAAAARRYVVQVGAYGDAAKVREVRGRVEKLGLKSYTQVIDTGAGKRTRVRVGPFDSRAEADSTGGRLKAAGLPVAVLAL